MSLVYLDHAPGPILADHGHMGRTILFTIAALITAVAACTTTAVVHDRVTTMDQQDFRERVEPHLSAGADHEDVAEFLDDLAKDPGTNTKIWHYPPKVVEQYDCAPRPCSLVDRGVPPGWTDIVVRVENHGHWLLGICTDEFIAWLVFDEEETFRDVYFQDADACP